MKVAPTNTKSPRHDLLIIYTFCHSYLLVSINEPNTEVSNRADISSVDVYFSILEMFWLLFLFTNQFYLCACACV